jgi:hypothetical protein
MKQANQKGEDAMEKIYAVGADFHKRNAQLVFLDKRGKELGSERMRTDQLIGYF